VRRKFYTVLRDGTKSLAIVPEKTRIVALQSTGERPPFFMVDSYPYFIDVVNLLGPDQPVLSLIGQEDTQPSGNYSIAAEAAVHVKAMLSLLPDGPFMLGGCSASGIVAYEIARQLRERRHEVELLVMFDTHNTHFMREYSHLRMSLISYRYDLSKMRWRDIPGWAARKIRGLAIPKIRQLSRRMNLSADGASAKDQFGASSSRIQAARKYRPEQFSGRFLLFKRYRELMGRYRDPSYGWGKLVRGKLEICKVSALDHNEIFESELDRALVAQTLRENIDEVIKASAFRAECLDLHRWRESQRA
jgi:thioesterase domain-containing protein